METNDTEIIILVRELKYLKVYTVFTNSSQLDTILAKCAPTSQDCLKDITTKITGRNNAGFTIENQLN